jgi:hypothetical protein
MQWHYISLSLDVIAEKLKGYSVRKPLAEFPDDKRKYFWVLNYWASSYLVTRSAQMPCERRIMRVGRRLSAPFKMIDYRLPLFRRAAKPVFSYLLEIPSVYSERSEQWPTD